MQLVIVKISNHTIKKSNTLATHFILRHTHVHSPTDTHTRKHAHTHGGTHTHTRSRLCTHTHLHTLPLSLSLIQTGTLGHKHIDTNIQAKTFKHRYNI